MMTTISYSNFERTSDTSLNPPPSVTSSPRKSFFFSYQQFFHPFFPATLEEIRWSDVLIYISIPHLAFSCPHLTCKARMLRLSRGTLKFLLLIFFLVWIWPPICNFWWKRWTNPEGSLVAEWNLFQNSNATCKYTWSSASPKWNDLAAPWYGYDICLSYYVIYILVRIKTSGVWGTRILGRMPVRPRSFNFLGAREFRSL